MKPATELKRLTDQCVMCGMCLPHCPTYHLTRDEAESPRGRISLIQGMSSGRLSYSPALAAHLDHCLACRASESVCPSGVRYGEIIAGRRALVAEQRPALSRITLWRDFFPSRGEVRGEVALFIGGGAGRAGRAGRGAAGRRRGRGGD